MANQQNSKRIKENPSKQTERYIAIFSGLSIFIILVSLALYVPEPKPFQYTVFRIILAIGCAAFAVCIEGFLSINFPNWLRAGGALGVFVIVYFFSPANLVIDKIPAPSPTPTPAPSLEPPGNKPSPPVTSPSVISNLVGDELRPANDPTPPTNCKPLMPNPVAIFLGRMVAHTNGFPQKLIQIGGKELVSINKNEKGLLIFVKIFGEDEKIIADIVDNKITANQGNYFKLQRPDNSTLIVIDQYDKEVLNIRYLNRSAIRVSGIFRYGKRPPLVITENSGPEQDCINNVGVIFSMQ